MAEAEVAEERYLTRAEVLKRVPVSNVTLFNWIRSGSFPAPRTLSGGQSRQNRIAWLESEIVKWVKTRPVRQYRPQQKSGRARHYGVEKWTQS
jgi:predicted DNA-binding transcriptional regulator AlpA